MFKLLIYFEDIFLYHKALSTLIKDIIKVFDITICNSMKKLLDLDFVLRYHYLV